MTMKLKVPEWIYCYADEVSHSSRSLFDADENSEQCRYSPAQVVENNDRNKGNSAKRKFEDCDERIAVYDYHKRRRSTSNHFYNNGQQELHYYQHHDSNRRHQDFYRDNQGYGVGFNKPYCCRPEERAEYHRQHYDSPPSQVQESWNRRRHRTPFEHDGIQSSDKNLRQNRCQYPKNNNKFHCRNSQFSFHEYKGGHPFRDHNRTYFDELYQGIGERYPRVYNLEKKQQYTYHCDWGKDRFVPSERFQKWNGRGYPPTWDYYGSPTK